MTDGDSSSAARPNLSACSEARRRFVGEPLIPERASQDSLRMATGEPGLPARFTWRGRPVHIAEVLRAWRETGPCRSGGGESYVRKHWYEVRTDSGAILTLYFERQARSRAQRTRRWWLHSASEACGKCPATAG